MKVLYELDLNDIIRIVAEKYGVPQEKVKKTNKDGLNYLMIDMSETETPEPLTVHVTAPAEDIKRFIDKEAEEVTVMFTPEETRKCSKGVKILEVELTDKDGKVRTLFQGKLTIKEDLINE